MAAAAVSRRARWFVATAVVGLVAWQLAAVLGWPRRSLVALGLFGFVLPMLFGKAFSLVPSYFARELSVPWAATVQYPLVVGGAIGLAAAPLSGTPTWVGRIGALAFAGGVAAFLGTIAWTIRDNPTGAETGTSEANADRRRLDRVANAAVPIALAYLAIGAYEVAAGPVAVLPSLVGPYPPRATHLLAAGAAGLMILAIGFRLLPRFLVVDSPRLLPYIVLPAGAIGPALIAASLPSGAWFVAGAALEAVAILGFGAAVTVMYARSDRRRVGFTGVVLAGIAGGLGVLLGLTFALDGLDTDLITVHRRANLLGFLGLTIVGLSYQFYPPAVAEFPLGGDRVALAAILSLAAGLAVEIVGTVAGGSLLVTGGRGLALLGALLHARLILGLFNQQYW